MQTKYPAAYPLFQGNQWTTRLEIGFQALFAAEDADRVNHHRLRRRIEGQLPFAGFADRVEGREPLRSAAVMGVLAGPDLLVVEENPTGAVVRGGIGKVEPMEIHPFRRRRHGYTRPSDGGSLGTGRALLSRALGPLLTKEGRIGDRGIGGRTIDGARGSKRLFAVVGHTRCYFRASATAARYSFGVRR